MATSYSSPILATVAGRPQILISGGYRVASYDPVSGGLIWKANATSRTTCATMVWKDDMVFASGSYPDSGTYGLAVSPQGARVVWENRVKCYEQSMLVVGEYLYGIADSGVAYCWRCAILTMRVIFFNFYAIFLRCVNCYIRVIFFWQVA